MAIDSGLAWSAYQAIKHLADGIGSVGQELERRISARARMWSGTVEKDRLAALGEAQKIQDSGLSRPSFDCAGG